MSKEKIQFLQNQGLSQRFIAGAIGVTQGRISQILTSEDPADLRHKSAVALDKLYRSTKRALSVRQRTKQEA